LQTRRLLLISKQFCAPTNKFVAASALLL
jgi:hypothetical protein